MMKEKRYITLKYRVVLIIIVTFIPFILLFLAYAQRTIKTIDNQSATDYANALRVFEVGVRNALIQADAFLFAACWGGEDFGRIGSAPTAQDAQASAEVLYEGARTLMQVNPELAGILFYSPGQRLEELILGVSASYTQADMDEITAVMTDSVTLDSYANLGWVLAENTQRPYLFRIAEKNGAYAVCFVDLDNLSGLAQTQFGLVSPVVFAKGRHTYGDAFWLRQYKNTMPDFFSGSDYYLLESGGRNYMVVSCGFLNLKAVYAVPYNGNSQWVLVACAIFITAVVLVFVIIWYMLKRLIMDPLYQLVGTMQSIRKGNLLQRTPNRKTSQEFIEINNTFNEMMDTIAALKIESYEQKLLAERTEMEALRLQIRPHFFLNCLKAVYGLTVSGQAQDVQTIVVLLSEHLRYTLDLYKDTVPLRDELDMCGNYIQLQGVGQSVKPVCSIQMDEELAKLPVPPVSVLSLVENTVKYARTQFAALEVSVKCSRLVIDETRLARILVRDNGPGFDPDLLQVLNSHPDELAGQGHVGILNVVRRFRLLFGPSFSVFFSNKGGACIELLVPCDGMEGEDL